MLTEKVKSQIRRGVSPLTVRSPRELLKLINLLSGEKLDLSRCGGGLVYSLVTKEGDKIAAGHTMSIKKLLTIANDKLGTDFDIPNCRKLTYCLFSLKMNTPIDPEILGEEEITPEELITTEVITEEPKQEESEDTEEVIIVEEEPLVENSLSLPDGLEEPNWNKIVPVKYSKVKLVEYANTFELTLDSKMKYKDMVVDFNHQFYTKYRIDGDV